MKYDFDQLIDRRGTYCTQWDYIKDRFGEEDLLPFSISDTDFMAPWPIRKKLMEVVEHGIYGYSRWNHEDFKGAVAGYFADRHKVLVSPDWVVYSPSVLYSIAVLFRLLSREHDRVLVFEPMYDAFYHVIKDNNREMVPLSLTPENGRYEIDFDRFENLVMECRIFLLCSPHNPTGRVWTTVEMDRMVELCRKHQVAIISDEIHSDVVLTDRKHCPVLKYGNQYDQLYLVSSASKTFNTPGLIGSYCALPDERVRNRFISRMRNRDFLNSVSLMGMHAMMTGYGECMDYADQLCTYIRGNMKELSNFVEEELKDTGVRFHMPEATYLAWIDMSRVCADSGAIQNALVHEGKVGIMPGKAYGDENYLRMNLGCPRGKLMEGLERMKRALDKLPLI
ncbi:MalY/PatB family protein [Lacrimispora sphenoides]|uniref:cysteine-S-conjugate beta-lyase n=1 Tax=Lacrimispora sphenoides JCM 1415 TaxID=1297793 RepID=A0ABY1C5F4_9FIRM|nr:PatB family C-S lyase [Lacrimispora sphenoides]SET69770.1 cystathione beta-lyase [[Clostridium] sphenoides JCM 1415]SUY50565.1 class I and II aminotransferase [Lacrimispora sphenoides]